jgi:hypothetical protein
MRNNGALYATKSDITRSDAETDGKLLVNHTRNILSSKSSIRPGYYMRGLPVDFELFA